MLGIELELATSKANTLPTYILSLAPLTTSLMSCLVIGIFVHSISGIAGIGYLGNWRFEGSYQIYFKSIHYSSFFVLHTPSRAWVCTIPTPNPWQSVYEGVLCLWQFHPLTNNDLHYCWPERLNRIHFNLYCFNYKWGWSSFCIFNGQLYFLCMCLMPGGAPSSGPTRGAVDPSTPSRGLSPVNWFSWPASLFVLFCFTSSFIEAFGISVTCDFSSTFIGLLFFPRSSVLRNHL